MITIMELWEEEDSYNQQERSKDMKITVIGTGYVGLIAGVGFADFGNDVICLDTNIEKIKMLKSCISPIYEQGIDGLLEKNINMGRINFTDNIQESIEFGDIIFIAVGTPESEDGNPDMKYIYQAAKNIGIYINNYKLVIDKSTVPVGTAKVVAGIIKEEIKKRKKEIDFDVVSNPEFLREGKAVEDFFYPDRIVIGADSDRPKEVLKKLYSRFASNDNPILITNTETAEMIKYASNAFLATKITFINEIADLCDKTGANVLEVVNAMGKDNRISPEFLQPGPGYGGSCFPKDTRALVKTGKDNGVSMSVVESVINANNRQRQIAADKIFKIMPKGGKIAVLGLSFKPGTDDIRESPAVYIVKLILERQGFEIRAYDPKAMGNAKSVLGNTKITWCKSAGHAVEGADAAVILTEWPEFYSINVNELQTMMPNGKVFDFRHVYSRKQVEEAGLEYYAIGF